jgi:hypothetical protein
MRFVSLPDACADCIYSLVPTAAAMATHAARAGDVRHTSGSCGWSLNKAGVGKRVRRPRPLARWGYGPEAPGPRSGHTNRWCRLPVGAPHRGQVQAARQ